MLGHLSLRPSSHRIYKSSAIGDLRGGEAGASGSGIGEDEVEGRPAISCSSVTTRPFAVISLLRIIRLCGNRPLVVWMYCLTAEFLDEVN